MFAFPGGDAFLFRIAVAVIRLMTTGIGLQNSKHLFIGICFR